MNFFSYLFFLVLILFARSLSAQDLEAMFKKENLIKVNGGINSSATLYQATGREANRNPFSYNVGGNVNVRLLGNFSFPLSFNYTTNSTTVTQPMFNQFNLAPSYKWVKLYFGSASLNLSSHTLASAPFSGFAFELSPGPWKISGMYGTLKQAVAFNPLNESVEGVFKRTGFGGKVGYKAKGWSAEVAFLKSEDNSASLDYVPTTSKTTPQSNISTQLAFQTKLFKKINLDANYATSGLTRDVRSPNSTESSFSPLKALMDTRTTTVFFNSYSLKASYDLKNIGFQLGYARTDPGFTSLGAYAITNDFENINLGTKVKFWKGKLNVNANTAVQRNNIEYSKDRSQYRLVNSLNVTAMPIKKMNVNFSYSTFSSFTNRLSRFSPFTQQPDSMSIYSVSRSINTNISYQFGGQKMPMSISLTGGNQLAQAMRGLEVDFKTQSDNYMGNMAHTISFPSKKISISNSFNYNLNKTATTESSNFGLSNSLSFTLMKLLNCSVSNSFNAVNAATSSSVLSSRFSTSYAFKSKNEKNKLLNNHNVSFNMGYTKQFTSAPVSVSEFTSTLTYGWTF